MQHISTSGDNAFDLFAEAAEVGSE